MKVDRIARLLQSGSVRAGDLKRMLGVSQPTLSRSARRVPKLLRLGETHQSRYALQVEIPEIGLEQALFIVDAEGNLEPVASLKFLAAGQTALVPPGIVSDGLPPAVWDLIPRGLQGKRFALRYGKELGFSRQLEDWTEQQGLIAVSRRGEDLQGACILGRESAERWSKMEPREQSLDEFPGLAQQEVADGGQARFDVFCRGRHQVVKFACPGESPEGRRCAELLRCEYEALSVLEKWGIPVVKSRMATFGNYLFLLQERSDRAGGKGRRPLISLAAVALSLYGECQRWSLTADRLCGEGRISHETLKQIKLVEAFCMRTRRH
jgi:hypothetical protein